MLTRRALLAAVPALALVPCGPTNSPQPPRVFIGRLDVGQDLYGRDPDPSMASWLPSEAEIEDWTRKTQEMARDLFGEPRRPHGRIQNLGWT